MRFPDEVLTKSKKGKVEARALIDKGEFFKYRYLDPNTGEESESKVKLVLLGEKKEEYFIIPVKGNRFLLLPAEYKGMRKVWDGKKVLEIG